MVARAQYVTWSRGKRRMSEILIVSYRLKEVINSYVLHCFWIQRIVHISATRSQIEMGFGSKCSIFNGQVIYIQNLKFNIADMWLIPLDRVMPKKLWQMLENVVLQCKTFQVMFYWHHGGITSLMNIFWKQNIMMTLTSLACSQQVIVSVLTCACSNSQCVNAAYAVLYEWICRPVHDVMLINCHI